MNGIKHTAFACSRSIRYIITVQLEYNKTYYQDQAERYSITFTMILKIMHANYSLEHN